MENKQKNQSEPETLREDAGQVSAPQTDPSPVKKPAAKKRRKKKKKQRNPFVRFLLGFLKVVSVTLVTILLVGLLCVGICATCFGVYINKYVSPEVDIDLDAYRLDLTTFVYYLDDEGNEVLLDSIHGDEDRVWVSLDDIPRQLQLAFISVEDARFSTHPGVDWKRTIGAAINYVVPFRDNYGGGSTITQQLIKNLTGEDETSVKRKIQEVMRALAVEKEYSKDEILELYLNTIYLGRGVYGVKQAAQEYFGKELDELTLGECAAIAGITKNPYKYDMIRFPEYNEERRLTVLGEMDRWGNITASEYEAAVAEVITPVKNHESEGEELTYRSYFIDALIDQVIEDLKEEKGYSDTMASRMVYNGGLKIIATIDPEIQAIMDSVFCNEETFPGDLGNDGTYPQASMVIMDPYTGYVKALYGGRGEKEGDLLLNRATDTYRQPGSVIKPISVYAPAIEYELITPITVVDDAPKDFSVRTTGWPVNENRTYRGLTSVYVGIGNSLNTIAVDVVNRVGIDRSFTFATRNMGLSTLVDRLTVTNKDGSVSIKSDKNASPLALGALTNGVSVLEMTAAYSAFVNNGKYTTPVLYTAVYDSNGDKLIDNTPITTTAMSQKTRDYMIDLLTYVVTSGTGKKAALEGIEVGGKTGTTSADNDRWFAGITPYYAGVVWFGYDIPQSLQKFSTNPALQIWRDVMEQVHADLPDASFEIKTETVKVTYCRDSGLLATDLCALDLRGSRVSTTYLAPEDVPTQSCTTHIAVELCTDTGRVATEYCHLYCPVKTIGALSLRRLYPYSAIYITDQSYCAPYYVTEEELKAGLFKPATYTIQLCTTHVSP
ncbi:MAG: transglycosylase domain-containing protein [Clostridia bacterium]|nr:transglycosylase domain-containing protein [Clostridia bacterium]